MRRAEAAAGTRAPLSSTALAEQVRPLAEQVRPLTLARERLLPVLEPLAPLLPDGGLQRGAVCAVAGPAATSLALALAAGPSAAGSWVGGVGLGSLGLLAASELGVALERLVLVATPPGAEWATVVAALVDAVDVVLTVASTGPPAEARRLHARVRERGAALLVLAPPGAGARSVAAFEPEITLTVTSAGWEGADAGAGHLRSRRVVVEGGGRRGASRPRRAALWLPGEGGAVLSAEPGAPVVALRGVG